MVREAEVRRRRRVGLRPIGSIGSIGYTASIDGDIGFIGSTSIPSSMHSSGFDGDGGVPP